MAKLTIDAALANAAIARIARAGYNDIVHDGAGKITVASAALADLQALVEGVAADEVPDPFKASAREKILVTAARVRAAIAGSSDPAKLAEYADKAAFAAAVIDGSAPDELIAEAAAEAPRYGLTDAAETAALWLEKAATLRVARLAVNKVERDGLDDVDLAEGAGAIAAADAACAALKALLPVAGSIDD